uniref:Tudor domain-containing protein n=1 Tax=Elaeophora elaphi TaxID=1147741 RepID=A0A0R3RP92_9BILA
MLINIAKIYLIDKGMQCEIRFEDIYEFPPELLDFALFSCICPVFVPSAEQFNIYRALIGQKCKCEVEAVSKSSVVLGYIRGRLLVENGDVYEDLQDIVRGKLAENRLNNFAKESVRSEISERDTPSWTVNGQMDDSSSSELTYRCSSTEKVAQETRVVARTSCKRSSIVPKKINCGQKYGSRMDSEMCTEYNTVKVKVFKNSVLKYLLFLPPLQFYIFQQTQALFTQTAFKQYRPDAIPTTINVRFDKRDRAWGRFWVINKSVFSTVETVLKESASRLIEFPLLRERLNDVPMREIPCVVRTRADSAYKTFYRAVPSRFDARTKRFSIFLVDFGWFKWVLAHDVIDISTMDKSNPIRSLPVAMIHCQEDVTSVLHIKDMWKGANCYMKVKGCLRQDLYLVDLLKAGRTDFLTGAFAVHPIWEQTFIGSTGETEGTSSNNKSPSETCERQLMASMMSGALNTANRDLAAQIQHTWPLYCPSPFSMMMPIALPMMMPLSIPNPNLPSPENEQTLTFRNAQENNAEGSAYPQNYSHRRFRGNNSQNIQREWCSSGLLRRKRVGFTSGDKAGNSVDDGNTSLSWEQASKFANDRRMLRNNTDNDSRRVRSTSWGKTVAADRAVRTQGAATGKRSTSDADDESG